MKLRRYINNVWPQTRMTTELNVSSSMFAELEPRTNCNKVFYCGNPKFDGANAGRRFRLIQVKIAAGQAVRRKRGQSEAVLSPCGDFEPGAFSAHKGAWPVEAQC